MAEKLTPFDAALADIARAFLITNAAPCNK